MALFHKFKPDKKAIRKVSTLGRMIPALGILEVLAPDRFGEEKRKRVTEQIGKKLVKEPWERVGEQEFRIGKTPIITQRGFFAGGELMPGEKDEPIKVKEFFQPKSYGGGRVGRAIGSDIESILGG